MDYVKEFDVQEFGFWEGAQQRIDAVNAYAANTGNYGVIDKMQSLIEQAFYGETPTETDINDYVWFQFEDDIYETLSGYECEADVLAMSDGLALLNLADALNCNPFTKED